MDLLTKGSQLIAQSFHTSSPGNPDSIQHVGFFGIVKTGQFLIGFEIILYIQITNHHINAYYYTQSNSLRDCLFNQSRYKNIIPLHLN